MTKSIARGTEGEGPMEKGIRLYEEGAVVDFGDGFFAVLSESAPAHTPHRYLVDAERETCECGDFVHRNRTCKHIAAATMFAAKQAPKTPTRRESARAQRKPSRFSGEWTAEIPSDADFERMGVAV